MREATDGGRLQHPASSIQPLPCVTVIGGGLAGCAAALLAAERGARVTLCEQRPDRSTELHDTGLLAELVGSNVLTADSPERATGLLKLELRELGCLILDCAERARLSDAQLAVDRAAFAQAVGDAVDRHPAIEVRREAVEQLPRKGIVILATGPTTWSPLARAIHRAAGEPFEFAFLGRSPVVGAHGIDEGRACWAPPYPGAEPVLFVPLSEGDFSELVRRLSEGERIEPPGAGDAELADEAEPVERLVRADPARFRHRVLRLPRDIEELSGEYAALRLRPDDSGRHSYQVEEFVTALTPEAQEYALRAAGGLAEVTVERPALVARVPYLPRPRALLPTLQMARTPRLLVAGLLAGALGYLEALATGCIAGISAARLARGEQPVVPPAETMTGGLCKALTDRQAEGQLPVSASFGLLPEARAPEDEAKSDRRARQVKTALAAMKQFAADTE